MLYKNPINFQFIPKRHVFVPKRVKVNVTDYDVFSPKENDDKENVYVSKNMKNISKSTAVSDSDDNGVGKSKSAKKSIVDTLYSVSPTKPTLLSLSEESVSTSFLLASEPVTVASVLLSPIAPVVSSLLHSTHSTTPLPAAAVAVIDETKLKEDLSKQYHTQYLLQLSETEKSIE